MENSNPYRAPESAVADVDATFELTPASRGRRFLTLVIDYISFVLLSAVIGGFIGLIWGDAGLAAIEKVPNYLAGVIIMVTYYIPFEAFFGRTIGKFVVGTKVVDENGEPPSFGQVVGRTFSRFIPFEAFSFFVTDGRGWHDSLPKTFVVMCR
jgi:uncharacterized RDD family membrane protein YckC